MQAFSRRGPAATLPPPLSLGASGEERTEGHPVGIEGERQAAGAKLVHLYTEAQRGAATVESETVGRCNGPWAAGRVWCTMVSAVCRARRKSEVKTATRSCPRSVAITASWSAAASACFCTQTMQRYSREGG